MTIAIGARLGPYEIAALVGSGGMGDVYRAHDPRLGRDVAVKVLPAAVSADPERLRRFEQEARAAAALNHPNILAVFDVGTDHASTYIVSELLDGRTLRETLASGPIPVRKAIEYAIQIAQGLAAAHDKGIIHRDLKPENVFVTTDGRVKILDFGLAKLVEPVVARATATMAPTIAADTTPGLVLGTVGYMSPEQVRGEPVDHRCDIFSFGAILYEMLSGERAFSGATSVDTMSAILHVDPPDVSQSKRVVPPATERIVRHCLEKIPAQRFQSARDLAFALNAATLESGTGLHPLVGRRTRSVRRLAAMAALAAALIGGGVFAGRAIAPRTAPVKSPAFTQLTFERGVVESARFAPDGRSVVYSAAWEGRPLELFSVRVESPESRPLGIRTANLWAVSSAGEMTVALNATRSGPFLVRGTLARAPMVGGTPREVLEGVTGADWSPDSSQIAVVRTNPAPAPYLSRLEFPIGTVLYQAPAWISHARVSPDGQLIAFADHPGGDDGTVVVVDRSGKRTITSSTWASVQGLAWAPNGTEVWFTAAKTGGVRSLYGLDLNGRERVIFQAPIDLALHDVARDGRVLVAAVNRRSEIRGVLRGMDHEQALSAFDWATQPSISNDGTMVVYNESGEASRTYGVFLRRADNPFPVRLGDGSRVGISPDNKWVVALSQDLRTASVLPVGPGEARRLDPGNIDRYAGVLSWFPDSRRVMFTAFEKGSREQRAFEQAVDGPPEPLARVGNRPSPDGRLYVCRQASDVGVCSFDANQFTPIPGANDLAVGFGVAGWTSDSRAVYAMVAGDGWFDVYRVEVETGRRERVKRVDVSDPAGLIFLGAGSITVDGRAYAYAIARTISQLFVIDGLK